MAKKTFSPYCFHTIKRTKIQDVKIYLKCYQTKAKDQYDREIPFRIFYYVVQASDGSYRKITDKEAALEAFAKLVDFEKRQTFLKL